MFSSWGHFLTLRTSRCKATSPPPSSRSCTLTFRSVAWNTGRSTRQPSPLDEGEEIHCCTPPLPSPPLPSPPLPSPPLFPPRPLHLPLSVRLMIESVSLSASVVTGSPLLVVRLMVDGTYLLLSNCQGGCTTDLQQGKHPASTAHRKHTHGATCSKVSILLALLTGNTLMVLPATR